MRGPRCVPARWNPSDDAAAGGTHLVPVNMWRQNVYPMPTARVLCAFKEVVSPQACPWDGKDVTLASDEIALAPHEICRSFLRSSQIIKRCSNRPRRARLRKFPTIPMESSLAYRQTWPQRVPTTLTACHNLYISVTVPAPEGVTTQRHEFGLRPVARALLVPAALLRPSKCREALGAPAAGASPVEAERA